MKDITSSFQILPKQLENSFKFPEVNVNPFLNELTGVSLRKELSGMSNKYDGIFKPLAGMSNKYDGIFKPSEIVKNSAFAELTNISKQIFDHLRNPLRVFSCWTHLR